MTDLGEAWTDTRRTRNTPALIPETDSENRSSRKAARQLRSVAAAIRATIGGGK